MAEPPPITIKIPTSNRTIIIGENGKIKNAFTSIFESNFEDDLNDLSEKMHLLGIIDG